MQPRASSVSGSVVAGAIVDVGCHVKDVFVVAFVAVGTSGAIEAGVDMSVVVGTLAFVVTSTPVVALAGCGSIVVAVSVVVFVTTGSAVVVAASVVVDGASVVVVVVAGGSVVVEATVVDGGRVVVGSLKATRHRFRTVRVFQETDHVVVVPAPRRMYPELVSVVPAGSLL